VPQEECNSFAGCTFLSILFDWDEANLGHIARNGVMPREAEEALTSNPIDLQYEVRNGELRIVQIGGTLGGSC
jgi:hypothetical protein